MNLDYTTCRRGFDSRGVLRDHNGIMRNHQYMDQPVNRERRHFRQRHLLIMRFLVAAAMLATTGQHEARAQTISGLLEVVEIVDHERDPWPEFQLYQVDWWIAEHEYRIELLRLEQYVDREEIRKRNDAVQERQQKITELRGQRNGLENEVNRGMIEVRGWDGRHGREIILQCRDQMRRTVRTWQPGELYEYVAEAFSERAVDGSLAKYPSAAGWSGRRPLSLRRVRSPEGPWTDKPDVFSWSTVEVTGDAGIEMSIKERRRHQSHAFTVLEARHLRASILSLPLREVHVHIDLVHSNGDRKRLTVDRPVVLRSRRLGGDIGWGQRSVDGGHVLIAPYPPPPEGANYEFKVVGVWVQERK